MQYTGIILAGGKSTRMGQDKGLMKLGGKPMITYVVEAMSAVVDHLMIIANDPAYSGFGLPVHHDVWPDTGPMGGICTGLSHTSTEMNLILSCDTPLASGALLKHLLQEAEGVEATVVEHQGQMHPLVGVYSKSLQPDLESHIQSEKLGLIKWLSGVEYRAVAISESLPFYHPQMLLNVNRPEELRQAEFFISQGA